MAETTAMQEHRNPPKRILILDLCTNLVWITANFVTAPFVGSTGNLSEVVTTKAFIIGVALAAINPILKQRLLFPAIMNRQKDVFCCIQNCYWHARSL